jgi:superfamily II DNA/RNA helicase
VACGRRGTLRSAVSQWPGALRRGAPAARIAQARHAAHKLGRNIRLVTRKRCGQPWTGRAFEIPIRRTIAKPIEKLNRLAQISILQALISSPEALSAQLRNMANKGTVPQELAATIAQIVKNMPPSAKLTGLASLIAQLKSENPDRWRLVIFTGRLETQTTIQLFLEATGLRVGIINGASGTRNADTLAAFRQNPPKIHIIVSTEAGSEGINLQVANMLVNYDLPWNPMIVEQRIGRIQRLASEHQNIAVFNVMLRGTFEEYIVGRLMEKLQMAAHAIGDVESLLQASGLDGDGEEESSFEEMIRVLILEALKGKDVEREVKLREESIEQAKRTLETEEAHINQMLGGMDDTSHSQPRCPDLPPTLHSMTEQELTLAALALSGKSITEDGALYKVESRDSSDYIRFNPKEDPAAIRSTYYGYGSPAFTRLVERLVADSIHDVQDSDNNVRTARRSWSCTNSIPRRKLSTVPSPGWRVGCPRRSRNWTSFSSPWARAWDGHDPDEVVAALDDKTEAVIRELEAQHKEARSSSTSTQRRGLLIGACRSSPSTPRRRSWRKWQPKGEPDLVDVHDFPSDAVGKAIPYGVYDIRPAPG